MNRLYERPQTKVIGNDMKSDADLGFKDEIAAYLSPILRMVSTLVVVTSSTS